MARSAKLKEITLVRYPTINECLAAHFNCSIDDIPTEGYWEWQDANGSSYKMPVVEAIKRIKRRAVWGWIENKRIIHFYSRKNATLSQLIYLFGHELGHMQKPYYKTKAEEKKASVYGLIAMTAYEMAKRIHVDNENLCRKSNAN